ncbi:MAG: hypothetical protein ACPLPW_00760 [bacterium]
MIGIDGQEYPLPAPEELEKLFVCNKELIDWKMKQGFTQLLLTPMAMSTLQIVGRVRATILEHAHEGKIFQSKQNSSDPDVLVRVSTGKPVWIWKRVQQTLDTPQLIYFPRAYSPSNHQGLSKDDVIRNKSLCAFPGWSVGLIEPFPNIPGQSQGKVIGGRKQLEEYCTPRDYLKTLSKPEYQGETGWTPEDFLTHFLIILEAFNLVSHDRNDRNALWLLGVYLPKLLPKAELVPVGYWDGNTGKLCLSAHRTGNRLQGWVGRTIVRLGI